MRPRLSANLDVLRAIAVLLVLAQHLCKRMCRSDRLDTHFLPRPLRSASVLCSHVSRTDVLDGPKWSDRSLVAEELLHTQNIPHLPA